MPNPTLAQVHVAQVLPDFSIHYAQGAPILGWARRMFGVIPVKKKNGLFRTFNKGDSLRNEAGRRAPGTRPRSGGYAAGTTAFECEEWSYEHEVPDEHRTQADFDIDKAASIHVTEKLLLAECAEFATSFLQTGVWTTTQTGAVDFVQWNAAGSQPFRNITAGMELIRARIGRNPNKAIIGPSLVQTFREHADFRALMPDNTMRVPDLSFVARSLGLDEIMVADGIRTSSVEGAADTFVDLVGDSMLLAYVDPRPAQMSLTAGATLTWSEHDNIAANGAASIMRWRDPHESAKKDWYSGSAFYDQIVVAADCGHLFLDCNG